MKRFVTEYENAVDGGVRYAGPILSAETVALADALTACVHGPNGEQLTVTGELIEQYILDADEVCSRIRPLTLVRSERES